MPTKNQGRMAQDMKRELIAILEYFATKLGQSMSGKKQEEQI